MKWFIIFGFEKNSFLTYVWKAVWFGHLWPFFFSINPDKDLACWGLLVTVWWLISSLSNCHASFTKILNFSRLDLFKILKLNCSLTLFFFFSLFLKSRDPWHRKIKKEISPFSIYLNTTITTFLFYFLLWHSKNKHACLAESKSSYTLI